MDIREIANKDQSELTPEELEALIEWKVEMKLAEKKHQQEHEARIAAYNALIDLQRQTLDNELNALQEMQAAAMARLEQVDLSGQAE